MNILVISPNYPFGKEVDYPFVKNLCDEFAKKGHAVTVLAPQSVTSALLHKKNLRPKMRRYIVDGHEVTVYQPYAFTPLHGALRLYNYTLRLSALRTLRRIKIELDVCYCHFWCSAYWVMPYIKKKGVPVIVASGESEIKTMLANDKKYPEFKDYVKGVICVSSKNRDESVALDYTTEDKCAIFPNAVNAEQFHKYDKKECRKRLGVSMEAFIVVFVGWFIERKGPQRVAAAIEKVGGVNSFFIGKGDQDPQCGGVLFKGSIAHEEVPVYLGAADCFVLPTLHEGCCNAVVEAMACGLPVVSSNLPFNWDVLDKSNSIMVDPNNVDDIADAIRTIRDNPELRERLSTGALKKAESLTIDQRADGIIKFIEKIIR